MTSRTPPQKSFNDQENDKFTHKTNTTAHNNSASRREKIKSPPQSANRDTEYIDSTNNRPVNRGERRSATEDDLREIKLREFKDENRDPSRYETYTAVKREINDVDEKVDSVNNKAEALDLGWKDIPNKVGEFETNMTSKGQKVDELEWRNKVHSAKIHELERELKNVRMHVPSDGPFNERDEYNSSGQGYSDSNGYNGPPQGQGYAPHGQGYAPQGQGYAPQGQGYAPDSYQGQGQYQDNGYPTQGQESQYVDPAMAKGAAMQGRPIHENDQYRHAHRAGGADGEEPYLGMNKYYKPQFQTAYRREQVPYYAIKEEKDKQTQYADDYNLLQELQRRQEHEWNERRRMEEEKLMKVKPKTYDYTTQYQAAVPPRDMNKYFHDSKYLDNTPGPKPDEYYFNEDVLYRENPGVALTTYEKTYTNPPHSMHQQPPGGLYIIRFSDEGYSEVNRSFREQQTIVHSNGGHILGIARKDNILVIEGDSDWHISRDQRPRPQITLPYRRTEDAMAVIWFPSRDKAHVFFNNTFRNRFKQQGFPTPQSWEGHYIPLNTPPFMKAMDTYLSIELLNSARYRPESVLAFETEARESMLKYQPNSLPFGASAQGGRDFLKPGPLFKDKSKVYMSRFSSIKDATESWRTGYIQEALQKWGLTGPVNVMIFSLKDWVD